MDSPEVLRWLGRVGFGFLILVNIVAFIQHRKVMKELDDLDRK